MSNSWSVVIGRPSGQRDEMEINLGTRGSAIATDTQNEREVKVI